jgi:transcriptional regulator with PAS, ATPase and Fis domain
LGVAHAVVAGQFLPGARGGDVHVSANKTPGSPLPNWMNPDWIQPVAIDGKIIGYTVIIPDRQTRAPQTQPNSAVMQTTLPKKEGEPDPFGKIVGTSEGIRSAIERGRRLAIGDQPVLILGETCVGKEEFANALHTASRKHGGPFVALNCAALSRDLVISELFGYVEGAFTGAMRGGRPGKFEQANGGTLFLDEVGELPLDVQASLLRVLQDGLVTRIGDSKARKSEVRIISATNRDLRDQVSRGLFREDLYYRLSVTTLIIPPLRMRQRDILVLAEYFLHRLETAYDGPTRTISPALHQKLMAYTWPGNIRELRNVLESMWHLSDGDTLDICHLPPEYGDDGKVDHVSKPFNLYDRECETIIRSIEEHSGNIRQAALALGIARSTLYEKMKAYKIRRSGVVSINGVELGGTAVPRKLE